MNATKLSARLADNVERIAQHLLPNGKKAGRYWKAGSVSGEEGQSLSVYLAGDKRGRWNDYATGDGGDLLDLWMACRGQSVVEAMKDAKAFLGVRDEMPQRAPKAFRRPEKPKCRTPKERVLQWLTGRGLSEDTIAAFRVGEQQRDGKVYAVLPYLLPDGVLANAKYRNPDDKRDMRQEAGAEACLFGWHLVDPKARRVAITEGELDAMTLHQVGIPALSVNAGAGNHQWIENDWERLERFDEIFLAFDDDEAGRKGVREVAQRLGLERCRVVTFGAKDANQWLQDGADGEEFHHALTIAKPFDPDEIANMADFMGAVKALFYPAPGARRDPVLLLGDKRHEWFEYRGGEYTVYTGYNGHGKSLMLNQILLGLMQQGERVMVFSGEMTPAQQGKRLVKQATGIDRPSPAYIDAVGEWVRDRMWLFNLVGTAALDRLLEVFSYAARRYGIRQFVIDSLMMTNVPADGPGFITKQQEAVQKITAFAKRTNSHVHVVAHPRKGRDESSPPGKQDVGGSGKIVDLADNLFSVWSAQKDESQPDDPNTPDALLELYKQRCADTGSVHRKVWLFFNRAAQQYCPTSRRQPVAVVEYSGAPFVYHQEPAEELDFAAR